MLCFFGRRFFSSAAQNAFRSAPVKTSYKTTPSEQFQIKSQPQVTFYRRPLPPNLISFTSDSGKQIFRESLHEGLAENYFSLVGNFTTQSEPAFCALGSLAMVLNALEMDPGRQWKGVWRWYSDQNLECAPVHLDVVRKRGLTFREFVCLARCNGLQVSAKRADTASFQEFLHDLVEVCSSRDSHIVISFSRKRLNQTGDGHFSPIGSFCKSRQVALVLDTARFKYPSYYAPVEELWDAMKPIDKETGYPRGYCVLKRDPSRLDRPYTLCRLSHVVPIIPLYQYIQTITSSIPPFQNAVSQVAGNSAVDAAISLSHDTIVDRAGYASRDEDLLHVFTSELQKLSIYKHVQQVVGPETALSMSLFWLTCPKSVLEPVLERSLEWQKIWDVSSAHPIVREEVDRVRGQIQHLMD